MKNFLLITLIILISCKDESRPQPIKSFEPKPDTANLAQAKRLSNQIFNYVEQVDKKKITKKQLAKKADPLQKELDSLIRILSVEQYKELVSYRTAIAYQMADRKVIRDKK